MTWANSISIRKNSSKRKYPIKTSIRIRRNASQSWLMAPQRTKLPSETGGFFGPWPMISPEEFRRSVPLVPSSSQQKKSTKKQKAGRPIGAIKGRSSPIILRLSPILSVTVPGLFPFLSKRYRLTPSDSTPLSLLPSLKAFRNWSSGIRTPLF